MLRDFIDSIKSISAYEDFKQKKLGKVLVYLLVISLVTGIIVTTAIENRYKEILFLLPESYDNKFPNFTIDEGILTTENNEKIVIEKGNTAIIFDTSSSPDENSLTKYKKGALLLRDKFLIKTSKFGRTEKKWSDFSITALNKEKGREYLGAVPSLLILFTAFFIIGLLLINIVSSLFISLVFTLVKRFWKKKLTFLEVFKMTVHSLTLPMTLLALGNIFLGDLITMEKALYVYYISGVYLIIAIGRTDLPKRVKPTEKGQANKAANRSRKK